MIRPNLPLKMLPFLALITLASFPVEAQTVTFAATTLHNFTNSDGANPGFGPLIMDGSGNLYGTTPNGGANGFGTVFELVKSPGTYTEKVLHSFSGATDGANPSGTLLMDAAGNLYGTTSEGGAESAHGTSHGTVFELVDSSGTYSEIVQLYNFGYSDGVPSGGLIMDKSGNFFGTLPHGGPNGYGTVFELVNSSGTYTESVLHTFNYTDGANPYTGVLMDSSGNLFGTTYSGGTGGYGTVFELVNSSGTYAETVLYSFADKPDGAYPKAGLIMDSSGNLFGTTYFGGTYNFGAVFELVKSSGTYTETVLYSFAANADGAYPQAGLLMDTAGNLYGTTSQGGPGSANGLGTVFELVNSSGTYGEKLIFSFGSATNCAGPDGSTPQSELIMDASGNLYGTTAQGGANGYGTVFEIAQLPSQTVATTMTFSSSPNPAQTDGGLSLTVTVASSLPIPPSGTVTFFSGSTQLGIATLACGNAQLGFADARLVGIGTFTITAQYNPDTSLFAPGSASVTQNVTEANVLLPSGNDTLIGNLTVTGSVSGSFSGDGSGLAGVNALTAKTATTAAGLSCMGCVGNTQLGVNYAGSASQGGTANSALMAANSAALGGVLAGDYARVDVDNKLVGNQTIAGNVSVSGPLTIGGGTPIKEHLSMVVDNTNFQNEDDSRAACTTISFPGVSDGDTVALGVPNSREAGGVIFYFAWAAAPDTIKLCRTVLILPKTRPSGAFRIDVWKH